jgi:glycopeptide antibiotics resistance protein
LKHRANACADAWKDRHTIFFIVVYITLVLLATLFPFDFVIKKPVTLLGIIKNFEWDLISWFALKDFPRNVVLFVPFGFAAAYQARRWGVGILQTCSAVVTAGGILSLFVEILQQFIPLRFSA